MVIERKVVCRSRGSVWIRIGVLDEVLSQLDKGVAILIEQGESSGRGMMIIITFSNNNNNNIVVVATPTQKKIQKFLM